MKRDEEQPKGEDPDAETVFLMVRSSCAFVLGLIFMAIPFTDLETGKPWYFWIGSGLAAFAFGVVLFYAIARRSG